MSDSANPIERTAEYFDNEYELELERWVRHRFRNLCIGLVTILIGFWALAFAGFILNEIFQFTAARTDVRPFFIDYYAMALSLTQMSIVLWFMIAVRPRLETKDQLIRSATQLIMLLSLIDVCADILVRLMEISSPTFTVTELFFWHFIACLFLPWTPWQSLKAIGPAYLLWAADVFAYNASAVTMGSSGPTPLPVTLFVTLFEIFGTALLFLPGIVICWARLRRHGRRFKVDMIGKQFLSLRRELQQARKIHDALFPKPTEDANCRFEFKYTPQTDIGGDFVFFERTGQTIRLILLDVTGHGLTAAMTVNRIHGEIERIRGEHPDGDPAVVMALLNRYFVLTLAPHNIYATGFACEVDLETGTIRWVNAGHPPAFVVSADTQPRELGTTSVMLGALAPEDFETDQEETCMEPGDVIIAYTDGVLEARDSKGRMLGLDQLRGLVASSRSRSSWPNRIQSFVNNHARGAFEDDVLVVALSYLARAGASDSALEAKPPSKEPTRA